jgi:hypothetical protein
VAEGIACARAGATIIHVHAYDGGGLETHDWQVYARIIEGIRGQIDVPVYPRHGIHPNYAIYDPGLLRAGAALARAAGARTPVYRLMFCDRLLAIGFPPRPYALAAYLSVRCSPRRWRAAAISASASRMRGWARPRAISRWSRKPCGWCAMPAPNRHRRPRCGRRWRRPEPDARPRQAQIIPPLQDSSETSGTSSE